MNRHLKAQYRLRICKEKHIIKYSMRLNNSDSYKTVYRTKRTDLFGNKQHKAEDRSILVNSHLNGHLLHMERKYRRIKATYFLFYCIAVSAYRADAAILQINDCSYPLNGRTPQGSCRRMSFFREPPNNPTTPVFTRIRNTDFVHVCNGKLYYLRGIGSCSAETFPMTAICRHPKR